MGCGQGQGSQLRAHTPDGQDGRPRSLLPSLEQHGANHDQGNDQDDDEFAKAKHDLADLTLVRLRGRHEALEFVEPVQDDYEVRREGVFNCCLGFLDHQEATILW